MEVDLLLYHCDLLLPEGKSNPKDDSLVMKDGIITAIGNKEELQEAFFCKDSIDLSGKTLMPGFIDAHVHFLMTGLHLLGLPLKEASSKEDLLDQVQKAAQNTPSFALIFGSGYDESCYPNQDLPDREELDRITSSHPIWLSRVDCHSSILNSLALELVNLPEGIRGVKYRDGEKTGLLRGEANSLARYQMLSSMPRDYKKKAIQLVRDLALQEGVTTIHALEGSDLTSQEDFVWLMEIEKELPLDLVFFYQTTDVKRVKALGLPRIGGCVMLDGSLGSSSAALTTPFADDSENRGILYFSNQKIYQFILEAHREGLQIATHVIGDRAIEQILGIYEEISKKYPRPDARHRLEHFLLPGPGHIERAAKLKLILSMQPAFDYYWGGEGRFYEKRLKERYIEVNPLFEAHGAGIILAGGSDSDVTLINPILGIHAAVNHSNPSFAMPLEEAIRMFTYNNAVAAFEEDKKGEIAPGKRGDLVVLNANPFRVEKSHLKDLQVEMTIYQGEVVYSR